MRLVCSLLVGAGMVGGCASGTRPLGSSETASASATSTTGDPWPTVDEDSGPCDNAALYFGPTDLPTASVGESYFVSVRDYAEPGWWGVEYYTSSTLPEGLQWSEDALSVSGIPTEAGSFQLVVEAIHAAPESGECGTHPDPHTFDLRVTLAPEGDTDTDTDGGTTSATDGGGSTGTGTDTD